MTALMRRPWTRGRHAWSLAIEEGAETEIEQFDLPSPRRVVHEVLGLHKKKKKNTDLELTLTGVSCQDEDTLLLQLQLRRWLPLLLLLQSTTKMVL